MSWMTRDLTLDLLAIGIHTLEKIYQRVKEEEVGEWPDVEPAPETGPATPAAPPAAGEQKPVTPPTPAAEETPDTDALRTEAQNLLRQISGAEGPSWITGTLFPTYGVTTLSAVPGEKLPELIATAQAHLKEAA